MKRSFLIMAIVLPFLWYKPQAKAQVQPTKVSANATWNLPKEIISQIKNTVVYKGVSNWLHKLLEF